MHFNDFVKLKLYDKVTNLWKTRLIAVLHILNWEISIRYYYKFRENKIFKHHFLYQRIWKSCSNITHCVFPLWFEPEPEATKVEQVNDGETLQQGFLYPSSINTDTTTLFFQPSSIIQHFLQICKSLLYPVFSICIRREKLLSQTFKISTFRLCICKQFCLVLSSPKIFLAIMFCISSLYI